jgi:serine/threonine protein phosphatase 1
MLSLFRRKKVEEEVLPAAIPAGKRVYAIGDIHGRLDLFDELLGKIETDNAARAPAETQIILLGDLIDRGPQSAGVVQRARANDLGFARMECLMGNHELSLLNILDGEVRWLSSWLAYGGRSALRSWGIDDDLLRNGLPEEIVEAARNALPHEDQRWLRSLPLQQRVGDYLFVHAGIRPGIAIDKQLETDLLWIREEFLESPLRHGAVVVHGHTITAEVDERHNRIGIDTGAYKSGRLTALGLEGSERWYLTT